MKRKRNTLDDQSRRSDPDALDLDAAREDNLAEIGRRLIKREFDKYHSVSPEQTTLDVDASWQEAEDSGSETPGGHVATPDQDNVDEIGRAVGMEFQDNQELRPPEEILAKRYRRRWELNRGSADGDSL